MKNTKGITLIALVITIIVLLILAGISINMLSGDNSILSKTRDAKELTDISSIKEQAELVKLGLQVDTHSRANSEKVKQNILVSAIHEKFVGSTYRGSKIITSDNKYDIVVDSNLNITVAKHQESSSNGTIALEYNIMSLEADPHEVEGHDAKMYINVIPAIEEENNIPSYDIWAQTELNKLSTDPITRQQQLENMFIDADKFYFLRENLPAEVIAQAESIILFSDWMEFRGESFTNINDFKQSYGSNYDSVEEMMLDWAYVKPREYNEIYFKKITIACGEENYTIMTGESVSFLIENAGVYTISATSSDGKSGEIEVNICIINPKDLVLSKVGEETNLSVDGNTNGMTWNNSNNSVIRLENGTVAGISEGTADVYLTDQKGIRISNICKVRLVHLKLGDFVSYNLNTPTEEQLTKLNNDIATYSGATDEGKLNTEKTSVGSTLLCRILEIDSNGNPTKLISADKVNSLKLKGADGYNNAVYLLNEACKTLYSGSQGITRSITIEDIVSKSKNHSNPNYSNTIYYEENAKYPKIAENEMGMGIGTTLVDGKNQIREGGLNISEQDKTYSGYGDAAILDSSKKGITTPKKTLYSNFNFSTTDVYYSIFRQVEDTHLSTSEIQPYWLASRGIQDYTTTLMAPVLQFCLYSCYRGVNYNPMFYSSSGDYKETWSEGLRPIIELNSGIEAEYANKYNSKYNRWTLK